MTDRPPPDEAPPAPPTADQEQNPAGGRIKWTRDQKLAWWANAASFVNVGAALAAFLLLVQTLRLTQDTLAVSQQAAEDTKRQADIAQEALVAATRARLKLTSVAGVSATRPQGAPVAWFTVKANYKNFGQNPAQNISFSPYVFVVGTDFSPKNLCEQRKTEMTGYSTEVIFPQDDGGGDQFGVQVLLMSLQEEAAKVQAIQPDATIYLGIVGCLAYKSIGSDDVHITGFIGDLHPVGKERSGQQGYLSIYDMIIAGEGPVIVEMEVKPLSAWAD